jgi:tetratricopeptide (TPR) repeat protein
MARLDDKAQVQFLSQALDIAHRNNLPYQEASALNELGLYMKTSEHYSDAIDYFSREASVAGRIGARYLQLIALENRAGCYLNLGELNRALQSLQEAKSQLGPEIHIGTRADVSMQLAEVYSSLKRNGEAVGYYREAFEIIRNDPKLDDYAPAAERLAAALIQTGRSSEAETYNNLAIASLGKYGLANSTHAFDSAFCELNRADIAAQRGQLSSALSSYRKALTFATTPNAVRRGKILRAPSRPLKRTGRCRDQRRIRLLS